MDDDVESVYNAWQSAVESQISVALEFRTVPLTIFETRNLTNAQDLKTADTRRAISSLSLYPTP